VREAAQIRVAAYWDPLKNSTAEEFEAAVLEIEIFVRRRGAVVEQYVRSVAGTGP
jgi:hypothetical protein